MRSFAGAFSRSRRLLGGAMLAVTAMASPLWGQANWLATPELSGNAGSPITTPETAVFHYAVQGIDKDTLGGTQYMDDTLFQDHEINSMSWHSVSFQGDQPMTGARNWNVSGQAVTVAETGFYHDRFRFDDAPTSAGRDDAPSAWLTRVVTVQNVP